MPTYTYRCLSCKDIQIVAHSMQQSFICPPCGVCGGLTEKIITQPPAVVKQQQAVPEQPEPAEKHHCGSACVLHRHAETHNSQHTE